MEQCRKHLSDTAVRDVFVLTYDCIRRYKGAWHMERKLLMPSYIFLESENEETLLKEIQKCMAVSRYKKRLITIDREERKFLKKLCGEAHHLEMSRGVIRKGNAQIMEGPLKGMESRILQIDRHKRLARIAFIMKPDCHSIPAGLEITEKEE